MTVTPAQGARGLLVSLAGSGLPAHRRASLFLARHRRLARFRADRRGDWTVRTRIPFRAQVGNSSLRVVIGRQQVIVARFPLAATAAAGASASSLTVLSSGEQVRLSPNRAPAGSFVALQGAGFQRRTLFGVWLGHTRIARFRVSARGSRRAIVRIPAATRAGEHVLSVRFRGRHLSLRLAVQPGSPVTGGGPGSADPVVDAAGDLACSPLDPNFNFGNGVPNATFPQNDCVQAAVSDLVVNPLPTAFLTTGDNQYGNYNGSDNGTELQYDQVYGPTFGRANSVVYPTLGDGDYGDTGIPNPFQFFAYFTDTGVFSRIEADGGNNANLTTLGYYSFNIGRWHMIALNSNCAALNVVGQHGCGVGSPEEKWLRADLAAHPGMCTLAYWHHPRWDSGRLGNDASGAAFWTDLYNAHADVVLNAHGNNHYERFKAQDPAGNPNPAGIVEFILSSGGFSHGNPPSGNPPFTPGDQNTSVVADYTSFGILQLTLHPTGYDFRYIPAVGTFTDSGSGTCHL